MVAENSTSTETGDRSNSLCPFKTERFLLLPSNQGQAGVGAEAACLTSILGAPFNVQPHSALPQICLSLTFCLRVRKISTYFYVKADVCDLLIMNYASACSRPRMCTTMIEYNNTTISL